MIIQERMSEKKFMPGWIRFSHEALYVFSAKYIHGKKVLDCACGEGIGSAHFLKFAASFTGVDISSDAVEAAKSRNASAGGVFIQGDATDLPFKDKEFDAYVSIETIEHIDNDQKYLSEASRVIVSNGTFICSSPNRKVLNPGKKITDKPLNNFHVREYSPEDFYNLLKATFPHVVLYGLNPNSRLKVDFLNWLGKYLPRLSARINQACKVPKLFFDDQDKYKVREIDDGYYYEILVAVCTNK